MQFDFIDYTNPDVYPDKGFELVPEQEETQEND